MGGAKIELIFADHQSKPELGMALAEKFINDDKVVAMMGTFNSAVANTVSPICERRKVPMTAASTATSLTQRGFKYFFRVTANAEQSIEPMLEFIDWYYKKHNLKMKGIGNFIEDGAAGVDNAKMFSKLGKKKGWKTIFNVSYNVRTIDLTSEVQKAKAADPDVLFQVPLTSDGILQIKTMKKFNWLPKIMLYAGGGNDDQKFQEALGSDADYITERIVWTLDSTERKPVIGKVNAAFKKFSGQDMDPNNARYITQLQVIADALNRAKSTDSEILRESLEKTNIAEEDLIMMHGVKFDPKTHDNVLAICLTGQRKDGRTHVVWPKKFATMEYIYPMVPWSQR